MPSYELVVIIREMNNAAVKAALKRCAEYVFQVGGTLRKMENFGMRNLPYKISSHGKCHRTGHFFVFDFDSGLEEPHVLKKKLNLDMDIVRSTSWMRYRDPIDKHTEKEKPECTLHVDLLPPPYRPNVIALQEQGRLKREKKKNPMQKNFEDTDFLIY